MKIRDNPGNEKSVKNQRKPEKRKVRENQQKINNEKSIPNVQTKMLQPGSFSCILITVH